MNVAFADTFYFLALLDSKEQRHQQALEAARDPQLHLVTTDWIVVELGDAYCQPDDRADFLALYRTMQNHPRVKIVPTESRLLERGVALFEQRLDKAWSLTDCISFVVMGDEGTIDALTGDRHFEQAGFVALLK